MEIFDIYNAQKEKTGLKGIRGVPLDKGQFRFVVTVLIFNEEATKLLIQKRVPEKYLWPNYWDFSVAGGVEADESLSQAAEREVYEELGLKLDLSQTPSRFTMSFYEGWTELYFVKMPVDLAELNLQAEEVADVAWVDEAELLEMYSRGEFIPYRITKDVFTMARDENNYDK